LDPDKAFEAGLQSRVAPALGALANQLAGMVRMQAQQAEPVVFQRWASEVDKLVEQVPAHNRTLDTYRYATDIVKGRHIQELAADLAQAKMAGLPVTERATGGASTGLPTPTSGFDFEKLSPTVKEKWQAAGITAATINEWCGKMGLSPEQFLKMTLDETVIGETLDGGQVMRPDPLKVGNTQRFWS